MRLGTDLGTHTHRDTAENLKRGIFRPEGHFHLLFECLIATHWVLVSPLELIKEMPGFFDAHPG